MATQLAGAARAYNYLFFESADPRTAQWLHIQSPVLLLALIFAYVRFVNKEGPRLMAPYKPFELKWVLIVFNAFQVLANLYLFDMALRLAWWDRYSFRCEPVDYTSEHGSQVAWGVYLFYLLKISDLLDTVFFVLRKRDRQITFLHIYHHAGMVAVAWGGARFFPGGHGTFIGLMNTFVHVVMYSYYLLTAVNPEYKKSIWWKKHLTQLQMVQFLLIAVHMAQLLWEDCGFPRWVAMLLLPQNVFIFVLFADFYRRTYLMPKQE